jgi:hypothetical protein
MVKENGPDCPGPFSLPCCLLYLAIACLRFSAQRRFIASAMAFLPSGVNLRFDLAGADVVAEVEAAFLLPLGRPRPGFVTGACVPERRARACCNFVISASICAITSVSANELPPIALPWICSTFIRKQRLTRNTIQIKKMNR